MAHAVSTRQVAGGYNNARAPGNHFLITRAVPLPTNRAQPRNKPSRAYMQVMRKPPFLCMHALPSFLFYFTCFRLFFESEFSFGQQQNTRDLDSCFTAMRYLQGLLKRGKRLRTTPPNQSRASPMIFAHSRFPVENLTI